MKSRVQRWMNLVQLLSLFVGMPIIQMQTMKLLLTVNLLDLPMVLRDGKPAFVCCQIMMIYRLLKSHYHYFLPYLFIVIMLPSPTPFPFPMCLVSRNFVVAVVAIREQDKVRGSAHLLINA